MSTTLIEVDAAVDRLGSDAVWVDCRFDLGNPAWGRKAYDLGHIPGAHYAHLDEDLSDASQGQGRHPLPSRGRFEDVVRRWGVGPRTHVIAYDGGNGLVASRLWWMLITSGVANAAVLNGGLAAWEAAGGPLGTDAPVSGVGDFAATPAPDTTVDADELSDLLEKQACVLVDARSRARFRGDEEPIDRVAGHVPGAINLPMEELQSDGRFLAPDELRKRWEVLLAGKPSDSVVHMCGSGVTACANRLTMDHAGLLGSRIYVGSWSDWIADPSRPLAKGEH